MKKTRRIAAMLAALTLAACSVAPAMMLNASAYDIEIADNGNITAASHNFTAFQLFTGTVTADKTGLTSIEWGSEITGKEKEFITALKGNATLNGIASIAALVPETTADPVATQSTAYDVSVALGDVTGDNAKVLASVVDAFITAQSITSETTSSSAKFTNLDGGYYFIKDTTTIAGTNTNDAASAFILKLTDDATVAIKTDAPTLEKKIWHNDNTDDAPTISTNSAPTIAEDAVASSGWNDVGDNKIGDTVYYLTKTAVPDMSDYEKYTYRVNDTLSAGLTFGTSPVTNIVYIDKDDNATVIEFATTATAGKATVTATANALTVDFVDLKALLGNKAKGGYIYTYYNATLNKDALVSTSANATQDNPNEAWLTYSNNPNNSGSGTPSTSDTPHDTVHEWTYSFVGEKVDGENKPVGGAGFTLKQGETKIALVAITPETKPDNYDEMSAEDKAASNYAKQLAAFNLTAFDEHTLYYRVADATETGTTENAITTVYTDATNYKNKFMVFGLDDTKQYTLEETKVPENYTAAADANVTITDTYGTDGASVASVTAPNADSPVTIVNKKASTLPSTGGIGTTLFYLAGGVMVVGAGVVLVTKKRLGKED